MTALFHENGDPKREVERPALTGEALRRQIEAKRKAKGIKREAQEFDCSPLPLFGSNHKQGELF